jgi:hypothetical protein
MCDKVILVKDVGLFQRQRGQWPLLNQPVGGSFLMKPGAWLLVMVFACAWITAVLFVCTRTQAAILPANSLDVSHLSSGGRLFVSSRSLPYLIRCTQSAWLRQRTPHPMSPRFVRLAEPPFDDEDQAYDGRSDNKSVKSVNSKLHLRCTEWWLSRPDAQRANSFINSKAKPPPSKQPRIKL